MLLSSKTLYLAGTKKLRAGFVGPIQGNGGLIAKTSIQT